MGRSVRQEGPMARVTKLEINGSVRRVDVDPERSLLGVLRDELDLTGAKYGCGEGRCGACTVLVDGQPSRSCLAKVGGLAGKSITTIEGLEHDGKLHPLQQAFLDADALQCGYCTPGMIMAGGGQNIRTSLAQAVAEELHAPLASIQLVMGDTARTPFDMGTFGSRTTPTMAVQLRRAAASAREALIDLAADRWNVDRGALVVAEGKVTHSESRRSLGFGELTRGKALLKAIGEGSMTTPADRWTVAGHSAAKVD